MFRSVVTMRDATDVQTHTLTACVLSLRAGSSMPLPGGLPLFSLSSILVKIGEKPRNRLLALLLSSVLVLGRKSIAERLSGYDIHTMDTPSLG